jgi:hypothetical protein|tara:strand:- start:455 stop:634 length:180 start_codon:yes stop_codon:yes gene_type:complete
MDDVEYAHHADDHGQTKNDDHQERSIRSDFKDHFNGEFHSVGSYKILFDIVVVLLIEFE